MLDDKQKSCCITNKPIFSMTCVWAAALFRSIISTGHFSPEFLRWGALYPPSRDQTDNVLSETTLLLFEGIKILIFFLSFYCTRGRSLYYTLCFLLFIVNGPCVCEDCREENSAFTLRVKYFLIFPSYLQYKYKLINTIYFQILNRCIFATRLHYLSD